MKKFKDFELAAAMASAVLMSFIPYSVGIAGMPHKLKSEINSRSFDSPKKFFDHHGFQCQPGTMRPGGPAALLVGKYKGIKGGFNSIHEAERHAFCGDWILVGPGNYRERADYIRWPTQPTAKWGAVAITKDGIHIRGMDRNKVVIDGTKSGPSCSSKLNDQDFGSGAGGSLTGPLSGRNGIYITGDGVSVENLTVCNFAGNEFIDSGNEYISGNLIWWTGGYDSGQIGLHNYFGQYLSATTTYYNQAQFESTGLLPKYGIFANNAENGLIQHVYASNMGDSSFYIGACPNCKAALIDAHGEYSQLGYSGTNSGGNLLVALSEFNNNRAGLDTNSASDDAPPPQSGKCPAGDNGPLGDGFCTYFIGNYTHHNNNPNTPSGFGFPIGIGMSLLGARYDVVAYNLVENNGGWGIFTGVDADTHNNAEHACGGVDLTVAYDPNVSPNNYLLTVVFAPPASPFQCIYDDFGSQIHHNVMIDNGKFGNPTNGDLADASGWTDPPFPDLLPQDSRPDLNCWFGNVNPKGITTYPAGLQSSPCNVRGAYFLDPSFSSLEPLTAEFFCSQGIPETAAFCTPGQPGYPKSKGVKLAKLKDQPSMPNPCKGVPANAWCSGHGYSDKD